MADGKHNSSLMKNKNDKGKVEKKTLSTLLSEVLQLVFSLLIVRDNIRASAVCKAWYKASALIRMKHQHPWLIKCPSSSAYQMPCLLYDPAQKMKYSLEYPVIQDMKVYYAKDGWLLMGKHHASEMCFFNPYSSKLMRLPHCENPNASAVFTCAPTSPSCMIFGLSNMGNNKQYNVKANTFNLGDTKWESTTLGAFEPFFADNNKIVFSRGTFYCLGGTNQQNQLGVPSD